MPTVLIGFGAATFQRKLHALLHAARLELFTKEDLARWCESLMSVASDYGVERLLSEVRGLPAGPATCWFQDTDSADIQLLVNGPHSADLPGPRQAVDQADAALANFDAEGFEDPHVAPAAVDMQLLAGPIAEEGFDLPPQVQLNFEHLLSVPGLLRVIDNATKGLGDVMQRYDNNIALAQQVCRLLRKRDTKPKLLERCFSRGFGLQLASDIREFQGWIHPGRWGTVVFSIPELLKVKHALVSCWDERLYLQGNDDVPDEGRRHDAMNLAKDVTKAVSDPAWWGWLSMLEVVCSLLRKHTFWAESCPCHSHILQSHHAELTAQLKQHFERCPLRGKRAAELSAGEFLDLLGQLWAVSTVQVLRVLPADVDPAERRLIVQEFDRARTHLGFLFYIEAQPFAGEVVAQLAAREDLASPCQHPVLQQLRGPLRRSCEAWLSGESLLTADKLDLQKFIASLRLVPTCERAVEGQRAKVHRYGLGRPNHTEHMQSYFVRSGEMARALEDNTLSLESFAWCCQNTRNHHQACVAVGLSGHPEIDLRHKHKRRNPMNSRVIYHADPFSLYTAAPPDVDMNHPPDRGHAVCDGDRAVDERQDALGNVQGRVCAGG